MIKKWLKRLRRLMELLDLLRFDRQAGSGGGGGARPVRREKTTPPNKWSVGTKDYVTIGGRSFVLQRGPGGTVRIFDASGRPVATAANRREADEVMTELVAEADHADPDDNAPEDAATTSAEQSGSETGGEAQ